MYRHNMFLAARIVLIILTLEFLQLLPILPNEVPLSSSGVIGSVAVKFSAQSILMAQEEEKKPTGGVVPELSFAETSYDFGTIPWGTSVSHTFVFRNTGKALLKILGARGS
jgi:hypothetical protein